MSDLAEKRVPEVGLIARLSLLTPVEEFSAGDVEVEIGRLSFHALLLPYYQGVMAPESSRLGPAVPLHRVPRVLLHETFAEIALPAGIPDNGSAARPGA